MRVLYPVFSLLFLCVVMASCTEQSHRETTPWGTIVGEDSLPQTAAFGLNDIVNNGELIVLTLSGADTYYDYHGRSLGVEYMLCERFAQSLGVSLRVEVCRDTTELVRRLRRGEGDIVAVQLPRTLRGVAFAGARVDSARTAWAVQTGNRELADTLNRWFRPAMMAAMQREERFLLSTKSIRRHVYSPMLNRAGGVISRYDHLFQRYAALARWDWRLLAAQCYQESTFDPQARSWAGACGLMQIMPATASHLGLDQGSLFDPEHNIAAAAKYIRELGGLFADVPAADRIYFVLASYNGGHFHIRDAMALARKNGRNPHSWAEVEEFVLKLGTPAGYNDPVVRHGYMRGAETADYVSKIRARWGQYRGSARAGGGSHDFMTQPERARRRYKWHL